MQIFRDNRRLISLLLVVFLILPFLVISTTVIVYSADTDKDHNISWLKGILLIILSFIINNFVEKNKEESKDNKIGDEPLIDINTTREILGFHVNWLTAEANSYESLKNNWRNIDMVAPFWYTVNPDGSIESRYGGYQYEVNSFASNRDIKVLPLINNNQRNNMILVDPNIRTKAVNNIVNLVDKYDFDGVNIDFEFIPPWTRNGYTAFIKELSSKLRRRDKLITISVFPKIDVPLELQGAYDYATLGSLVDRIVIMTYDNHWSGGPAGPIAPINWVEENIKYALEYIPADKILLGIANYGYDWPPVGAARDLSAKKALELAHEKGAEIKWSEKFQSPFYYYWDEQGQKHEVWFESSSSMAFKLDLVNKYNLQGIAIWRLGNETDHFWHTVMNKLRESNRTS
ncbi:MAG: hypothetical protein PWR10_1482 [Halanaerobiales bacterium]|nr:hypothetical protein [Halanaerobiales bacterium]